MKYLQQIIDFIASLFATLFCYIEYSILMIIWAIVQVINLFLEVVAALVNAAISLLPESNADFPELGSDIIGMLNWLFPVGPLVVEAGLIITAWVLYRAYRYLFRWVI